MDHTGEATARIFSPTCDERIKYDIRRIEDPLAVMRKIKGVTFRYIDTDIFGIGFTAQDVESAFPEAVSRGGDITLKNGDVVKVVKRPDTYGVAAALHHESILQLMGILKETITTIAGTTSDTSTREALEVLANKIPAQMK
ncbi:TPA: tail fiber domain-containing protein [Citrobacter braakii]|nr:tail fiber domain-containing protein [Citrobacter braakii]HEM7955936.1 tail fiber domain-containing protein [Citrobacter braakii]